MTLLVERAVLKPWGRSTLPPPFPDMGGARVGEIWFEPPEALNTLLVKYIFTSEKLSVQCHPSNAQTQAAGLGQQGKEECWLILDAEPGAQIAIGFNEGVDQHAMKAAAIDGSIEQLLSWYRVKPGDFFYIPANTVHAIGAGVTLIEVQQNSDITYRLYDYGRPRELHLDAAVAIADGTPYPATQHRHVTETGSDTLVDGPYFRFDRLDGTPGSATIARYQGALLVMPLDCAITVDGTNVRQGQCALAHSIDSVGFAQDGHCLIAQPI